MLLFAICVFFGEMFNLVICLFFKTRLSLLLSQGFFKYFEYLSIVR